MESSSDSLFLSASNATDGYQKAGILKTHMDAMKNSWEKQRRRKAMQTAV